ncbi:MAG: DNA methyltransferase [Armatimonadota bacterium]
MAGNILYYGDNLDVLRRHVVDESIDLIYLDPPFNSARDYNVLFKQAKKDENQAQITAFTDTWQWSKARYDEFFDDMVNARLFDLMTSLHRILGNSEMMAYLVMMAPRLSQLHRVLKPTGSLYLHCDPTASHYLKLVLDVVFGPTYFRNELIWKRYGAHSNSKGYGAVHDVLLYYSKSDTVIFNKQYMQYSEGYVEQRFRFADPDGRRWSEQNLANPDVRPNLMYAFTAHNDITYQPPPNGWKYSKDRMEQLDREGRLHYPKRADGRLRLKNYLDEMPGVPVQDVWVDISLIGGSSPERLGYPTQKPLSLLERIINTSSNPGDIILDPFCGCGTAVEAAEKLGRQWIGIDITFIAIDLIISRLHRSFSLQRNKDYLVLGDPKDMAAARDLFHRDAKQFEIWAVGLVQGVPQERKGGDRGIDGKVYFHGLDGELHYAVCQVKGGHLTPSLIRDFAHVIEREKAASGFFISLETPSKGMYQEAEELGFYTAPSGRKIPRLQMLTIHELLHEDKVFDFPVGYAVQGDERKRLKRDHEQQKLSLDAA